MEDNKLKVKLKISLKDKNKMFPFIQQPPMAEPSAADGDKEVGDELEEGEIREDDGEGELAVSSKDGVIVQASSNKRVCPHCLREFNGGKALGGHLRVHTEPKFKSEGGGSGPGQAQDVFPCTLCYKKFRSEKALFGHMRSHPERDYRGMQIPESGSGHKPAPGPTRRPVRVGWKVKGRRGQNGCAFKTEAAEEAEGSSSVSLKEDEWVAAEVLRHFSKCTSIIENEYEDGNNNNDNGTKMEAKREFDEDELYFLRTYFELNTNSNSDNAATNNNNNDSLNCNSNSIASTSYSTKEVEKPKKKPKLVNETYDDVVSDDVEEDNKELNEKRTWECTICNKTFLTHQALGGHKSSHSKEKEKDVASDGGNGKEITLELQYKCKICDQSFASGQALGGHQRSHYVHSHSSSLESSSLEQSLQNGRRDGGNFRFEFDLNLMANDDVDGDHDDGVLK